MNIYLIYQNKDKEKGKFKEKIANITKQLPFNKVVKNGIKEYPWSFLEEGDYILVHFSVEDISLFCQKIKEWKNEIKKATDKEVVVLPISSVNNLFAGKLYAAVEDDNITSAILEESKKFWENACRAVPKIEVIAKLLGLSILIDTAEIVRRKNNTRKFEEMKKEITKELEDLRKDQEQISKGPDEEWPKCSKTSLQEIINASDKLFTPNAPKTPVEIYKDIKNLKNKLQGSQK